MALMPPVSLCEITLWQHLAGRSELAERGRERADSLCLKSDMVSVSTEQTNEPHKWMLTYTSRYKHKYPLRKCAMLTCVTL